MHFAPFSKAEETWSGNRYYVPGNSRTPLLVGSRGLTVAGWKAYEPTSQSVQVRYPDAGRTLNGYASDFLTRARGLSRQHWDTRYLAASAAAYIKAGFRGGSAAAPPSVPVISVPARASIAPAVNGADPHGRGALHSFRFVPAYTGGHPVRSRNAEGRHVGAKGFQCLVVCVCFACFATTPLAVVVGAAGATAGGG